MTDGTVGAAGSSADPASPEQPRLLVSCGQPEAAAGKSRARTPEEFTSIRLYRCLSIFSMSTIVTCAGCVYSVSLRSLIYPPHTDIHFFTLYSNTDLQRGQNNRTRGQEYIVFIVIFSKPMESFLSLLSCPLFSLVFLFIKNP